MIRDTFLINYEHKTIEFSVVGNGDPILLLHGGHSNSNENLGYKPLIENGFQIITPSRPGYGKTSKHWNDLDQSSEVYKKILDHLNINHVHVIAVSAGGPSGIHFAATYHNYVKTLSLQSAVTKQWLTPKNILYHMGRFMFNPISEKLTWRMVKTMNNLFPQFIFNQMAPSFTSIKKRELNNKITDMDIEELKNMNNRYRSGYGFMIDIQVPNQLQVQHLHKVNVPTLIIHSIHDGSVPLEHALYAHQHIKHSSLFKANTWGHLIWVGEGSEEVHQTQIDFLNEHAHKKIMSDE